MKDTLIILAVAAAILYLVRNNTALAGKDLGNGWRLLPNGIDAVGPNGETAKYTGYASGDPYPSAGYLGIF